MSFLLASAARATVGARSEQEDSFRVWPVDGIVRSDAASGGLLAVLADGMGGHTGGAIAGQTACATFADAFAGSAIPYPERLQEALQASNEALALGVERNAVLRGMGCTLVAAWIDQAGMRWTSVGDSLLLLYRYPEVIRLNADHSLGSLLDEQARQNIITPSEAKANLNRHALRSALTGAQIELIDMHADPLAVRGGDWIVLASDGICSLGGDEIAEVIGQHRHATPAAMAEGLIGAVLAKGVAGQDNATVVVVRVDDAEPEALDAVTTRVVLRPARGNEPSTAATRSPGQRRKQRSLLISALDVSPAIWLGAAAGLLLIAVVMALRGPQVPPEHPAANRSAPAVQDLVRPALEPPTQPAPLDAPQSDDAGAASSGPQDASPAMRVPPANRPDAQDPRRKRERIPRGATN